MQWDSYAVDEQVGQVQDMGNRFVRFLNALRAATPALTRVGHVLIGVSPQDPNKDFLQTVAMVAPRLPQAPPVLTMADTTTMAVVPMKVQPEVGTTDAWLLTVHGYQGPDVTQGSSGQT